MTQPMTFADWQVSKRIVPWTVVHDWDEEAFLARQAWTWALSVARRLTSVFADAFEAVVRKINEVVTRAADAFVKLAESMQGHAEGPDVAG